MGSRITIDKRIGDLEKQVDSLRREVSRLSEASLKTVVLRLMTQKEARAEILSVFQSGRTLYYSDIVQELGIDIDQVVEVCEELESEGRIETIGHTEGARRSPRSTSKQERSKSCIRLTGQGATRPRRQ